MTQELSPLLAPPFKQCAVVVEDLDEAVRRWAEQLGDRPLDRLPARTAPYSRRCATTAKRSSSRSVTRSPGRATCSSSWSNLSVGRAFFADHLAAHGEGLHHVGKYVTDHAGAVAEALRAGFRPLQSARGFGAEGDGAFAYFHAPGVSMIVELIEAPRVRIEPEFVYYPPAAD